LAAIALQRAGYDIYQTRGGPESSFWASSKISRDLETGAFRLAQGSQHGRRIVDCSRDDVVHVPVRFVGRQRRPAIGGELLEIEHRRTLVR
jgi:hypothetical protein